MHEARVPKRMPGSPGSPGRLQRPFSHSSSFFGHVPSRSGVSSSRSESILRPDVARWLIETEAMRTAASLRQACLANAARGKHGTAVEAMRKFLAKHGPSYPRLAEDRLSHTIRLCNELALICIQRDAAELHAAHAYLDWACRTSAAHSAPIALRAVTLNTAGIYFMRSGAPEVALRCLASAITAGGSNATDDITIHASLNMTTALAEMGRHGEALDTAEEVVRLLAGPRSPTRVPPDPSLLSAAHHNLAVQQQRMGLSETAMQSYRAAAEAARQSSAGSLRPTVQDVDHAARFIEKSYLWAKRLPDHPSSRPGTPSSRGTQDPLASHPGPSKRFPTTVAASTTLRSRMSPPSSAKMRRSSLNLMPMEAMQPTSAADRELLRVALSMVGGAPSTAVLEQEAPASLPAPLPAIVGSGTLLVLPMVKSRTMPQLSRTPGAFRSVAEPSQQASPASSASGRTMPQLSRTPDASYSVAELSQQASPASSARGRTMPQLSRTPDASFSVAELSQQTSPASSAGAQGGSFHTTRAQQTVRSMSARREEERQAKLGAIKTRKEASSNEVAEVAQAEALRVEAERVTAERAEAELLVQAMAQAAHASDEVARMQQEQRVLEERVASPQRREASQGDVHGMRDELYSQLREALALESQRGAQEFAELMEPELVVTAVRLARQNLEAERTEVDEVATEAVKAGRTGADQLATDAAEAEQVHTIKDAEQSVAAATTEVEEAAAPKAVFEPAGTEIDVTPCLGTVSSLATSVTLVAEVISAGLLAVTGVALPAVAPPVPAVKELEVEHAEKQVGTEEVQPDRPQELQSSQPEQVGTEEVQPHQLQELESSQAEQVGTEEVQPHQLHEPESSQAEQVGTEEVQPHQLHEPESSQAEQVSTEEVQPHQLHEPESSQAEQVGTEEVQPDQLQELESSQAQQVGTEEVQPHQLQELESSQAQQVGTEEVQPDQLHEPESSQAEQVSTEEEVQPDQLQEPESSQAEQVGTEEVQPDQLHEPESSQAEQVSTEEEVQPDQLQEPESSQAEQVGTEEVQPHQLQELESSQAKQVGTEEVQPDQLQELESSQAQQVGTEEVQPDQLHEPESSQAEQVGTEEVQPDQLHELESSQAQQVGTEEVQPDQLHEPESSQAEQVSTEEEVQPDQLHEPESSQAQEVSTEEVQPDHLQELESSQAKQVSTEEVQPHQLHEPESSQAQQVVTEEVQPHQLQELESSQAKQVGTEEVQPHQLQELESSQPEQVGTEEVQPDQLQELQSSQAKQVGTEEVQPDQLQEPESSQAEQVCTQEIQPDQLQEELVLSQRPDTQPPVPSSAVKLEPAVQQELEVAADDEVANVASAADKTHATSEESEMHQERWTGQDNFDMREAERLEAKRLQAKLAESERLAAEKAEAERFEEECREAVRLDAAHADLARAEEDRQAEEKAAADEAEEERGEAVPLAKKPEGEQSCAVEAAEVEQMAAPPVAPEASAAPVPEAKTAATAGAPPASNPSRRAEEAEPAEPAPETVEIAQSNETDEEDEVPWTPAAVASAELTLSTAEKLVAAVLLASDEDVRLSALDELRQFTNDAYGADAAAIGAAVRAGGAMAVLVSCVDSSSSDVQQTVLSLLGNLLTDVFDRHARKSLALFVEAGGLAALQAGLRADYPVNLFATATLQNITSLDAFETCARLREQKCADELIAMMHATDDAVMKSYVTAVLANLRAQDPEPKSNPAIEEAIRMRRLASIVEMMQTGKAVSTVHRLASRWLVRHRARKAMEAECGAGVVASTEAAAA